MPEEFEPRLYLIGRSDIPQMNAGKLAAQAAHAADEFEELYRMRSVDGDSTFARLVEKWREDRSFGVTITLIGTDVEIRDLLATQQHRGYVHDPTYPLFNETGGFFTWPIDTMGWCFPVNALELQSIQTSGLDLYP